MKWKQDDGTKNGEESSWYNYFVTTGKGLEQITEEEVKSKAHGYNIYHRTGKVFFSSKEAPSRIAPHLKSVERFFISVHDTTSISNMFHSKEQGLRVLHAIVMKVDWKRAFLAWLQANPSAPQTPSFRVSCKKSKNSRDSSQIFSHQDISRVVASGIKQQTEWKVDLHHHDLEIYVHLSSEGLTFGLPLHKEPLSKREYIKQHGLRCCVAWSMARVGDIKRGDVVCDPMCGLGTILIEAAKSWPSAHYIGMDNNEERLGICEDNIRFAKLSDSIDISAEIPLRDESVNVILCDVPFGQKFGSYEENKVLYPLMMSEMKRILAKDGRVVLLSGQEQLIEWVCRRDKDWKIQQCNFIQLGVTKSHLYCLVKQSSEKRTQSETEQSNSAKKLKLDHT